MTRPIVQELPALWRTRADELERFAPPAAIAFRDAALALELALRAADDEALTLAQASERSGLSIDRLRHKVAAGEIPNVGRKHAPRVRAGDLPAKGRRPTLSVSTYDPDADARALAGVAGGAR